MSQPLALVFYERLMPGSQLVNRLQDMNYRVMVVNDPAILAPTAKRETPMLLVADLARSAEVFTAIEAIKADAATEHLGIIVYAPDKSPSLVKSAQEKDGLLAVTDSALLNHLEPLIEQALEI